MMATTLDKNFEALKDTQTHGEGQESNMLTNCKYKLTDFLHKPKKEILDQKNAITSMKVPLE